MRNLRKSIFKALCFFGIHQWKIYCMKTHEDKHAAVFEHHCNECNLAKIYIYGDANRGAK